LERDQVAAVPGQEVPAAVLALAPVRVDVAVARHLIVRTQGTELLPQVRVDAVDRAVEAPAGRLSQRPRLHRLDAARVPEDRVGPVGAQLPDVPACEGHGFPLRSRAARGPPAAAAMAMLPHHEDEENTTDTGQRDLRWEQLRDRMVLSVRLVRACRA